MTRPTGSRGADGYTASSTSTVLDSDGDAQSVGRETTEQDGFLEEGGVRFFAVDSVAQVEVGDDATVTREDGTTIDTTVQEVQWTGNALLLSLD